MKDNNIYRVIAEYNAGTNRMTITTLKNGRLVNFSELPRTEQNKLTALLAQSYVYLDENNKKVNNNSKNYNDE